MSEPKDRRAAVDAGDGAEGSFRGRSVAKVFTSEDGMTILVGKSAADNDVVTFRLGQPQDFWLHVAAESGSHVIVRNPDGLSRLPKATEELAASLAAGHSKARHGGKVAVHLTTRSEVSKPRGLPPGKVQLRRFRTVKAVPRREPDQGA